MQQNLLQAKGKQCCAVVWMSSLRLVASSDILVLKLISVLVFILFSSQNFYFILFQVFGSMIILVFIQFFCMILVFILFSFLQSVKFQFSFYFQQPTHVAKVRYTMSLQQLVQSTTVYKTACLFSVHVVKSVSRSTVWFSFKQARICSDLYILLLK